MWLVSIVAVYPLVLLFQALITPRIAGRRPRQVPWPTRVPATHQISATRLHAIGVGLVLAR